MESRVKIFGHPIHPMLIVFPAGSFTTAVIFDVLYLIFRNPTFPAVSFYTIALGVIGGLLAAVFGFIDWSALPNKSRARSIGVWHGTGNFVIVVLFALSWLLRRGRPNLVPGSLATILSFAGIVLALITLWIGGELVYRLGVAVDPGANVNASSSLSGKPASTPDTKKQTDLRR
jgi:uncharacterized membrane protein